MAKTPPNFLIFCTDQMRADHMGCAGNPIIQTPNLDRLAAEGIHFPRAYVNCPLCMPSRASLFTGLTPRGHRVRTNGIPLDPGTPTITQTLSTSGYATASIGKIHLSCYLLHSEFERTVERPDLFPECGPYWERGLIDSVPTPYFGLQHVELTIGHGRGVRGDYARWLGREHPDALKALKDGPAKPSPLGAEGCATYPIDAGLHHSAYVADRTIRYLRDRDPNRPFYLMCSFPDPHHPYHLPEPWDSQYSYRDIPTPLRRDGELDDLAPFFKQIFSSKMWLSGRFNPTDMPDDHRREILAYTYGMISLVDHHLGRVLACLEEQGLAENTIVAFISDHGDLMGDHGLLNKGPFHFEGLLRIPMIWWAPSRFRSRSTQALASLLDFAPTILDLAGLDIPEGPSSPEAPMQPPAWPGQSLAPILTGTADSIQDSVIIENDEDYLGLRLRTLVTPTHKITTYTGHRGPESFGELFDLENDPHEIYNLWHHPDHATLKQDLITRLHYRLTETDIALPRRISHA